MAGEARSGPAPVGGGWALLVAVSRFGDGLNRRVGRAASWLTLLMVLVAFFVALSRYLFNIGSIAWQESVVYMHAAIFMLGIAYTLGQDGHVRVDPIYRPLSERNKAVIDLLGALMLLFPVAGVLLYYSWDYVAFSWSFREGSKEAGGLPLVWLLKTLLLIAPILIMIQGAALIARNLIVLIRRSAPRPEHRTNSRADLSRTRADLSRANAPHPEP